MSLSMYQASVPGFISILQNLTAILAKAEAHATTKKIDLAVFVNARLAPDMLPLARQIQIATTFPELKERIAKTIAFLETFKPEQIDGSEDKVVTLKLGGKDTDFKGQPYLLHFVIPNFYFHVAMTYALLRHNGVDIGKMDYLGPR